MRQEKVQSFFSQTSSSVIFIFSVARRLMNVFYAFNLSSALAIVVYSVILAYSAFVRFSKPQQSYPTMKKNSFYC